MSQPHVAKYDYCGLRSFFLVVGVVWTIIGLSVPFFATKWTSILCYSRRLRALRRIFLHSLVRTAIGSHLGLLIIVGWDTVWIYLDLLTRATKSSLVWKSACFFAEHFVLAVAAKQAESSRCVVLFWKHLRHDFVDQERIKLQLEKFGFSFVWPSDCAPWAVLVEHL